LQEEAGRIMDANRIRSLENKITAAEEARPGWFARTILGNDGEYDEAELAEMRRALRDAKTQLATDEYAALLRDPEFAGYIEQGRGMENPTLEALMGSMPWNYDKYIVNKATFASDNKAFFSPTTQGKYGSIAGVYTDLPGNSLTDLSQQLRFMGLMTDDEVNIYSGILNSQGEEKADEYYEHLKPELTRRAAETVVNAIEAAESPAWVRHVAGFQSGAQQAWANLEQLFNREEWVGNRTGDYVPQMLVEKGLLSDTGANVSSSIGGQVPQMAANLIASPLRTLGLNKAAGAISAAVAGATASGGALRQSMGEGYSYSDAADYALASGISEAATSWILDSAGEGINVMTGGWLKRAMNGIQSPLLRGLARFGLSSASEGVEEMIQEPIGNALGNWLLDKDEKIFDAGQMLESGLAGMIAGAIMGTGNVSNYVQTERMGDAVLETGKADVLIEAAKSMGKDSEAAKMAQKIDPETISAKEAAELAGAFVKEGGDPAVLMPDKAEIEQGAEGSPLEDIYRRANEQAQSVEQGEAYSRQVQRAYDAGLHGMEYEVAAAIDTEGENRLSDALMKEAYNQGVIDLASAQEAKQLKTQFEQENEPDAAFETEQPRAASLQETARNVSQQVREPATVQEMNLPEWTKTKGGVIQRHSRKGKLSKAQYSQMQMLSALGKKYGVVFVVEDSINYGSTRANAAYMGDNVFRIALDADEGAYIYFAAHEMAHYLKRQGGESYKSVADAMREWADEAGIDYDARIEEVTEKYARAGQQLSHEMAEEEVVGDIIGNIFANEKAAKEFLHGMDKGTLGKIKRFLNELLSTVRTAAKRIGDKKGLSALNDLEDWAQQAAAIVVDAAMVNAKSERQAQKKENKSSGVNAAQKQSTNVSYHSLEDAVRYSLQDVTEGVDVEAVMGENKRLQKIYDALIEKVGNIDIYKGKIQSEYIEKQARKLLREFKSKFSYDTLVNNLTQISKYYEEASKKDELDSPFLVQLYADVMRPVLEMSEDVDKTVWEEGKELRAYFKKLRFSLNSKQRAEVASTYGSVKAFQRSNFGRFVLAQDAPSLDTFWPEIAEKFPYIFKDNVSDAEMPQLVKDAIEATRPVLYNPYGLDTERYTVYAATRAIELMHEFPIAKTYLQAAKEAGKRKLTDYKQWEEKAKLRRNIARQVNDLMVRLAKPTDAKHIPEGLRKDVFRALAKINYTADSPRIRHVAWETRIAQLRNAINNNADALIESGLDPEIAARVNALAESIDSNTRFEDMTAEQLKTLRDTMSNLKRALLEQEEISRSKRFKTVADVAISALDHLALRKDRKSRKVLGAISDYTTFSAMSAGDFMRTQFGDEVGGEVYRWLRNGQDKAHGHIKEASEAFAGMMERAGVTYKERKGWEKNVREYVTEGGRKVYLTETQLMTIYALSGREQGKRHLLSERGGIVPGEVEGVLDGKKIVKRQMHNIPLTETDLKAISGMLTDQQRKMADMMVEYMSTTVSEWGNAASMDMYGYRKYTEEHYWPIQADRNAVKLTKLVDDNSMKLNAAKSKGFTKSINEQAANPVEIGDALDIFGKHVIEMANYDGYAPAVDNLIKLLNTNGDETGTTLRMELDRVTGKAGESYLRKLLEDINRTGQKNTDSIDRFVSGAISRYKKSAVMAKPRVAVQQYTAVVRALNELSPAYLVKGIADSAKHMKKSVKEMQEHAPIAWWKNNGNYDTHVGRAMLDIVLGDESAKTKIDTASMWLAGALDNAAWAGIWEGVKAETEAKHASIEKDSAEYWDVVRERFNEVVDQTQVVDTVLHRSQMARSKGVAQSFTAFMSEPLRSYNMLRSAAAELYQKGWTNKEAQKKAMRAFGTLAINGIFHSLVLAAYDSLRYRDDEEEDFASRFAESLIDDINPIAMLPLASDALDAFVTIVQGGTIWETNMATDGIISMLEAGRNIWKAMGDYASGESRYGKRSAYGLMKDTVNSVSRTFGLPAEGVLAWAELVVNSIAPGTLRMTNPTKYENLKKAVSDGNAADAQKYVDKLLAEGTEMGNIRSTLTSAFKGEYIRMYEEGDMEGMAQLRKMLAPYYKAGESHFDSWLDE
jgi:hypothetical protein